MDINPDLSVYLALTQSIEPTTFPAIDQAIADLADCKERWSSLSATSRTAILEDLREDYGALCKLWVEAGLTAKDAINNPYAAGMEWACGPFAVLRFINELRRSWNSIARTGKPFLPGDLRTNGNGQLVLKVYPTNLFECLTLIGLKGEIWMEPGVLKDNAFLLSRKNNGWHAGRSGSMDCLDANPTQGSPVHEIQNSNGGIVLVLGGGNVSGIPANDALSKLFIENKVVILKMHPANEYLGPLIEKGFRRLIEAGYLRVVYGGVAQGDYLVNHPQIEEIHLTGSDKTYEAIYFGTGDQGSDRKRARQPRLNKRFTSELGNIGPAIIVPGPWSTSDITYQSEQVASNLCDNASYSCSRARVIIQQKGWQHRQALLEGIRQVLGKTPARPAYYPGSRQLYERFLDAHPEAEQYGVQEDSQRKSIQPLPWTLIPDVDPASQGEICFQTEAFCPVIAETALEAASPAEFIDAAVAFANERLWGTLTANILIHPCSLKDSATRDALERAVRDLRYGVVAINCLTSLGWLLNSAPWGSYPGNPPWDIQSGAGFVHNTFMLARPQKTVLRAPFRIWPRPVWFPSQANAIAEVGKRLANYQLEPSFKNLLGIIWSAVQN